MRKITLLAVVMGVLLAASGCGLASSATNELCLVYSGGLAEDAKYVKQLKPGSNQNSVGFGSETYCYKIDQRSYIATDAEGKGDTGAVEAVSSDTTRMGVEYQLYFTLNQDEDVLQEFHENLGVKTEAWTEEGWKDLLRDYVEPQIERAIESAALAYPWRGLYSSEETRREFQSAVVETVQRNLREVIGNDYFCGPKYAKAGDDCGAFTFTVGKPYPKNADIVAAVESEQTAAAGTAAQAQKNAQIEERVKGEQRLVDLYGAEGAVLLEAIRSGKVDTFIIAGDSATAVPVPRG